MTKRYLAAIALTALLAGGTTSAQAADHVRPGEARVRVSHDRLVLHDKVHFALDSASLDPRSLSLLDEVAAVIRANPNLRLVEIHGHTDAQGSSSYNLSLSQQRAETVVRYLVNRGKVNPRRLRAIGHGESQLLIDRDNHRAHATNRRVEFKIRR